MIIHNGKPFNHEMLTMGIYMRSLDEHQIASMIGDPKVGAYMTGFRYPSMETLREIAAILDFPISFFFRKGKRETKNTWMCVSFEQRLDDNGVIDYGYNDEPVIIQLRLPLMFEIEKG